MSDAGDAAAEKLDKLSEAAYDASYDSWPVMLRNTRGLRETSHKIIKELVDWVTTNSGPQGIVQKYSGHNADAANNDSTLTEGLHRTIYRCADHGIPARTSYEDIADKIDTGGTLEGTYIGWLQYLDNMGDDFDITLEAARSRVKTAHEKVAAALQLFTEDLNKVGRGAYSTSFDPFASLVPPKPKKPKDDGKGGGKDDGKGDGTGGGGTGGGGTGGGTGGGGTGGGTPTPPSKVETPEVPDFTTPEPAPGKNPYTGGDLEIDPETGTPYPIDPETGEPVKDGGGGDVDVNTTTVTKGDKQLSITEPNSTGEMSVDVDDGTGNPKQYKLDFAPEESGKRGEGDGAAFGPQGMAKDPGKDGIKGDPTDEVHTPDEDGKIRIKDGDLEIIAEQPLGPDGATVVTVDDGDGKPETYLLGDEDAVQEFQDQLTEDEARLSEAREDLEARGDDVTKEERAEFEAAEQEFRERGGRFSDDESGMDAGDASDEKDSERAASAFEGGEEDGGSGGAGLGSTSGDGLASGGGAGGAGVGAGVADVAGGGAAGVGDSPDLEGGARSGAAAGPAPDGAGGAGVAAAPAGAPVAAGGGGQGGGAMGGGMMGGAMGGAGGGGGDDQQRSSSAYQVTGGLFEPDVAEGPFGVARISGSLDDEGS